MINLTCDTFNKKKKQSENFPALIYLTSPQNIQHKIKGKLFTPVIALQFSVFFYILLFISIFHFFLFVVFCFSFFLWKYICGKFIFFDFIFQFKRKPYKFKLKAIAPNNPHQLPSVIKINTKAQTQNLFIFYVNHQNIKYHILFIHFHHIYRWMINEFLYTFTDSQRENQIFVWFYFFFNYYKLYGVFGTQSLKMKKWWCI